MVLGVELLYGRPDIKGGRIGQEQIQIGWHDAETYVGIACTETVPFVIGNIGGGMW